MSIKVLGAILLLIALGAGLYVYSQKGSFAPTASESSEDAGDGVEAIEQSIVGKWEDLDSTNTFLEFKADGTYVSSHLSIDGEEVVSSHGTFTVFTKKNPVPSAQTLEEGTVYLEMTTLFRKHDEMMGPPLPVGDSRITKVGRLTPDAFEMTVVNDYLPEQTSTYGRVK